MTNLNFSNQNLQNRSFRGENLAGADFSNSDLKGCDFTGTSLTGANFRWAKTGQSSRQISFLVAGAIAGPFILVGCSFLLVYITEALLPEKILNVFFRILPFLVLVVQILFGQHFNSRAPRTMSFFSIVAFGMLMAAMALVTVGLLMGSISSFGTGSGVLGLLFLALVAISAIVTHRIFIWILQIIRAHPGTSFKRANLTDADFSYAQLENTDFSLATLTGVCIFECQGNSHTQFKDIYCEYLYLESPGQKHQPIEGTFQSAKAEQVLSQLILSNLLR